MELKEAREMAVDLITVKDTPVYIRPMCEAFMLLDDRVTELEAQKDELVTALLGFALKTSHHTPSLSREWLQAIKLISSIKGKPWEEIDS